MKNNYLFNDATPFSLAMFKDIYGVKKERFIQLKYFSFQSEDRRRNYQTWILQRWTVL